MRYSTWLTFWVGATCGLVVTLCGAAFVTCLSPPPRAAVASAVPEDANERDVMEVMLQLGAVPVCEQFRDRTAFVGVCYSVDRNRFVKFVMKKEHDERRTD